MIWHQIAGKTRRRLARARIARELRTAPFALTHAAAVVSRRAGDFTCNFYGVFGKGTESVRYALNGGAEKEVRRGLPRVPSREFVIELGAEELFPGRNRLELLVAEKANAARRIVHEFEYHSAPPRLPVEVRWDATRIEVGDGVWEMVEREGVSFVRPRAGHEGYDRSVFAVGAFDGGRRIEATLVYRSHAAGRPFGFGLHPLWGGRPGDGDNEPRRGWKFSFAGYYSSHGGAGMEFSTCTGGKPPDWVGVYRNFEPLPGRELRLVVEVLQEREVDGSHFGYRQRMRLAEPAEIESAAWLELTDRQGVQLPDTEYGVAILAHNCQVEFGPLTVSRLPASTEAKPADESGRIES